MRERERERKPSLAFLETSFWPQRKILSQITLFERLKEPQRFFSFLFFINILVEKERKMSEKTFFFSLPNPWHQMAWQRFVVPDFGLDPPLIGPFPPARGLLRQVSLKSSRKDLICFPKKFPLHHQNKVMAPQTQLLPFFPLTFQVILQTWAARPQQALRALPWKETRGSFPFSKRKTGWSALRLAGEKRRFPSWKRWETAIWIFQGILSRAISSRRSCCTSVKSIRVTRNGTMMCAWETGSSAPSSN